MVSVLIHIAVTMLAVWVTTALPGIELGGDTTETTVVTLLAVSVLFGLVNVILKPIAKTLGCLLYVLTLGLFGLIVNALLLWLTSYLAGKLELPFHVAGFWPAFWGALVITLVSSVLHGIIRNVREPSAQR